MPFVTTQVTRMSDGHVCIAGVEQETGRHVRPCLEGAGRHTMRVLARNGGPFDIGAIVNLGATRARPVRPECEDVVLLGRPTRIGDVTARDFWQLLDRVAQPTLEDIFGDDLEPMGRSCGIPEDRGDASLGVLRPRGDVTLQWNVYNGRPVIKAVVPFLALDVIVPVTDVRLFDADCVTPNRPRFDRIAARLRRGAPVLLGVGLSRPYAPHGGERSHWMQVNGIFFDEYPLWRDEDDRD